MKLIYQFLFEVIPPSWQKSLGKSAFLKPLRDLVLRPSGKFAVSMVDIEKKYLNYDVKFKYFAAAKIALKAKRRGVENTILINTMSLLKKYKSTTNDCVVFDVGTNFGYLSMVWALTVCKKGNVHGFEANHNVFSTFGKTIEINQLNNVSLNYNAVGAAKTLVKMYDMDTTSNVNATCASNKYNLVNMISLDSYIKENNLTRCDLVKIDVDGIEYDIIIGGLKVLNNLKPIWVIECNDDKRIVEFFIDNNYHILDMELNIISDFKKLPPNIFCLHKTL